MHATITYATPYPMPPAVPEWKKEAAESKDVKPVWSDPPPPPMTQEDFGKAFRQGYNITLRFLLSRGARTDAAEEIAQAAWAKGWECRGQLQRPHMIGAWVNSIAKNMLKNRMRAEQRLQCLNEATRSGSQPRHHLDVDRILSRCEERDSTILKAFYLEGYTSEEIAQQVGLTPVAVRVRLLRIRRALRSYFHREPAILQFEPQAA